jgi:hypothetical protein
MSACGSTSSYRIHSSLNASQYNDIANKYMPRPTFLSIVQMDGYPDMLQIKYDTYSSDKGYQWFSKEHVDDYVALIDKYLKWEEIATRDGDLLNKEIGTAKLYTVASIPYSLRFSIFSANKTNNYLVIGGASANPNPSNIFSKENAIKLKMILIKFKDDNFSPTDQSKYK